MTETTANDAPTTGRRGADDPDTSVSGQIRGFAHPAVLAVLAVTVTISVIERFRVTSPLWLDEALSVNIASLSPSRIPDALRHDGHPPLYYYLLHGWMSLVGEGDQAVRALSGLISVATAPLAYLVGRRVGGPRIGLTLGFVFLVSPYTFRYGSETRMYALVIALVFLLYLFLGQALEEPRPGPLAGIAVVTGALLWTHYWSLWLITAVGLLLLARLVTARRRGDAPTARSALLAGVAVGVGALTFLPWLPTMLYQSAHTGTPWGPSFRPATLIMMSLTDFNGGPFSEPQVGMVFSIVLLFLGIFGSPADDGTITVRFSPEPNARWPLTLLVGTIVVATTVGVINKMAFHPRYAAVYFPFVLILLSLGINKFRDGPLRQGVLLAVAGFALVGMLFVERQTRTQSEVAAAAIRDRSETGLVITCPDQLGPAVSRALTEPGYEILTYPRFEDPRFVDWVDYGERNRASDPLAFAAEVLDRAGDRPIFVVNADSYLTLEGKCQRVIERIAATRAPQTLHEPDSKEFYEPMRTIVFDAPTGGG